MTRTVVSAFAFAHDGMRRGKLLRPIMERYMAIFDFWPLSHRMCLSHLSGSLITSTPRILTAILNGTNRIFVMTLFTRVRKIGGHASRLVETWHHKMKCMLT